MLSRGVASRIAWAGCGVATGWSRGEMAKEMTRAEAGTLVLMGLQLNQREADFGSRLAAGRQIEMVARRRRCCLLR